MTMNVDTVTDRKSFGDAVANFRGFQEKVSNKKNSSEERREKTVRQNLLHY